MLHARAKWQFEPVDEELGRKIAKQLGIHPVVSNMLLRRGVTDVSQANRFLNPALSDLHDPFLMDGMDKAAERIHQALTGKEPILIYGDYDADGVSSTSLLLKVFAHLGASVDYYIPHRFREGYGIHKEALKLAKERGFSLVISVDTGISAVEEAAYAKELGLNLIITDHHEPQEVLPDALAVINPKKPGCPYPFKMLAGVGVAFKLATALLNRVPEEWLDIVALGTIADLVPLVDENRILAYYGLKRMNQTENKGIQSLIEVSGIDRTLQAAHVGFALGPRINASGRLDSADTAVRLLITDDCDEAEELAGSLDKMNWERQQLVEEMTLEAIAEVEENPEQHQYVIVVARPGWNVGVVGIVASRLVEKYYRPVLILGIDEKKQIAKGSARSIQGFHLFQALSQCKEWLPHFGGHAMAAGMTLKVEDIPKLHDRLSCLAKEWIRPEDYTPLLTAEGELEADQIVSGLIDQLAALAPYGVGNPTPLFIIKETQISRVQLMGRQKEHMKLFLQGKKGMINAVGFRLGSKANSLAPHVNVRLLGELQMNEWNGKRAPQVIIRDLEVPHLQVFDWRSNRKDWSRLTELDMKKVCFVCTLGSPLFKQLTGHPDWIVVTWEQLKKEKQQQSLKQSRYLVLVESPPTLKLFKKGLSYGYEAERIYVMFGDKEFDDLLPKTPTRDDFKKLYKAIARIGKFPYQKYLPSLMRITGLQKRVISFMIQVFEELGFVTLEQDVLILQKHPAKKPLNESKSYQTQLDREHVLKTLVYSSYRDLCRYLFSRIAFKHIGGYADGLQGEDSSYSRLSATGDQV
ncbi:single-stranded-DNA-specific exonuclease RecJ [Thermoactinomyces mirandus]|uniref:Single-stranded-DNA-specific exonuclease RecJ n=1 Tax=Thermoactinomyces mirandus TaxID=2756294 RepID=A0A7W2APW3_9BACL|nr:single-stranded-DNA-specific exonuclease RecJ [Thermoactinomyces mirandus]MBA4600848.1 single-stranded-DNA-specific exonuclease RecJ [Thermoactinomyces mirandus]